MKAKRKQNLETNVLEYHDDGCGGWAHGAVTVGHREYHYEVKHFDEGSQFGIDNGRVSKLRIIRVLPNRKVKEVCAYDRGWYVLPCQTNAADMAAYKAVLKKYN